MKSSFGSLLLLSLMLVSGVLSEVNNNNNNNNRKEKKDTTLSLSPADWPPAVFQEFQQLEAYIGPHPPAVSDQGLGVVAGTSNAFAIHAGQTALAAGGSAIDAAIVTSTTQIALVFGCYVSYGGIAILTYHDAETNQTYYVNGGWNSVINETDPLSIPGLGVPTSRPGREFLTPGYFAALEAAHQRWGKLDWSVLFEPAIYFAQQGVTLTSFTAGLLQQTEALLMQSDYGRQTFFHPNGTLLGPGDVVYQPQLAYFLGNISQQGASYFYEGGFADELATTIEALGGNLTKTDLLDYQAIVSTDTLNATYNDFTIRAINFPTAGGLDLVEAINILSHFNLSTYPFYVNHADSLFWMLKAARWGRVVDGIASVNQDLVTNAFPGIDLSPQSRALPSTAAQIAEMLSTAEGRELVSQTFQKLYAEAYDESLSRKPYMGTHSDGVVSADAFGNVLAMVHSINCFPFGMGYFVQGVALNNAASVQQTILAQSPPGSRIPDPTAPALVYKDGKPVFASATIGSGLHEVGFQNLINYIEYGIEPDASVLLPNFLTPDFNITFTPTIKLHYPVNQIFLSATFNQTVLEEVEAMGQGVEQLSFGNPALALAFGFWVGLSVGNTTSATVQRAGASPLLNGYAEAVNA